MNLRNTAAISELAALPWWAGLLLAAPFVGLHWTVASLAADSDFLQAFENVIAALAYPIAALATTGACVQAIRGRRPPQPQPGCPQCGQPMLRRQAVRGRHAGRFYWGCSAFPKCDGVRPIGDAGGGNSAARPSPQALREPETSPPPALRETDTSPPRGLREPEPSPPRARREPSVPSASASAPAFEPMLPAAGQLALSASHEPTVPLMPVPRAAP